MKSRVKQVESENARLLELLGTTEQRAAALSAELEEAFVEKDNLQALNDQSRSSLTVFEVRISDLENQLQTARTQLRAVNPQTDEERVSMEGIHQGLVRWGIFSSNSVDKNF